MVFCKELSLAVTNSRDLHTISTDQTQERFTCMSCWLLSHEYFNELSCLIEKNTKK